MWSLLALPGSAAENPSAAVDRITLPAGFHAELVYTPSDEEGSWVSMAVDSTGQILTSDEHGSLYRIQPAALGSPPDETQVKRLDLPLAMAQGLLCVGDDLYVMVNARQDAPAESGLYRVDDSDGDGDWDRVEQLRVFRRGGEHGPHAVILGPDGESLYFCSGNMNSPPLYRRTLVPPVWGEDQLLPRLPDPRGHGNDFQPPGGWIARCDLEGNALELVCVGFRNIYDIAFNEDGELFTFDADMEWDVGMPWYRPTRICHATSGVDFGWRSGNGKWRDYYIDSRTSVVDVGPGSPTGITFGTGAAFPKKYQNALFAADWSYGRIFAVHLTPDGATYRGQVESFASAMPLAVTDMEVRPQDGALYFLVGGRRTESALYRIVYDGQSEATRDALAAEDAAGAETESATEAAAARKIRHRLESFHGRVVDGAVDQLWPYLDHEDRVLQSAARIGLEHQPLERWHDQALNEDSYRARIAALAAAARVGSPELLPAQSEALLEIPLDDLPRQEQLDLLRTMGLTSLRLGPPTSETRHRWIEYLLPHFPTGQYKLDSELARLLVHLQATEVLEALVARMEQSESPEQGLDFAIAASAMRAGWTTELHERMLKWFLTAARYGGGASSLGYLQSARERTIGKMAPSDREQLASLIDEPLAEAPIVLETAPRSLVKKWTVKEVVDLIANTEREPDYERGRELFAAASCYQCHRMGPAGSTVGPDLTGVGRRFSVADLATAIVEPNKTISDQYQQMVFETGGRVYVGRVTNLWDDEVSINTNILDPKSTVTLKVDAIDDQFPSDVSMMPAGLLDTLTAEEIVDLFAFLRAGGGELGAARELDGVTVVP